MLQVHVTRAFPDFTLDAAFEAPAGVTAIFGPSGSGKTSLIRAVAGLSDCDHARITLGGRDLSTLKPHRRNIGYVFQDARLFPHLTVLKNLRYGGRHDEEAVIAVLGLAPLLGRHPASLSGGERQRVALGRALMSAPHLLLLDEPLSALDSPRKAEVLPYLEALRDQTAIPILYVSHDMTEVARLARRIVVLDRGQVVVSGALEDVLADPAAVPFIGVRDAGAVLSGRVVGHSDDGLTKIETEGGALWVPGAVGRALGHIRVRVPAQDVILSRSAPEGLSALNVLSVTITGLERGTGPDVAVALQAGQARLLARVTARSCDGMGLQVGDHVFAILKATAIAPGDVG
ncbi:molybdenum ABC transporter ATP-binding protein [Thalassorhabdomicrobium marinisediminis]|uniref:Molybdenum ABC transporter ATP-binding protein n=1 Tax=Thalassorhabdomicrobium marinisediminis TaxID=2170577 RepID=A0A2T7FUB6_9RHOB|nr:molybdenum ABC transporter ATP-binding protein [Thalassorhabdomicrobium marinisediminis]PVA05755.1 molybdenum ABC transporter ATP-binding protein [Thalassorhabdomicrobium marinisediminis]